MVDGLQKSVLELEGRPKGMEEDQVMKLYDELQRRLRGKENERQKVATNVLEVEDRLQKLQYEVRKSKVDVDVRLQKESEISKTEHQSLAARQVAEAERRVHEWTRKMVAEGDAKVKDLERCLKQQTKELEFLRKQVAKLMTMQETLSERVAGLEFSEEDAPSIGEAMVTAQILDTNSDEHLLRTADRVLDSAAGMQTSELRTGTSNWQFHIEGAASQQAPEMQTGEVPQQEDVEKIPATETAASKDDAPMLLER